MGVRSWALGNPTIQGNVSGAIELGAMALVDAVRERRFGNRQSMRPYKRPYNSGTTRIRLLASPSVTDPLTCG
jgi:hypothetical protein